MAHADDLAPGHLWMGSAKAVRQPCHRLADYPEMVESPDLQVPIRAEIVKAQSLVELVSSRVMLPISSSTDAQPALSGLVRTRPSSGDEGFSRDGNAGNEVDAIAAELATVVDDE